ncbi:RNA polymerase sigma factor [Paenibacillus sp. R14(2021)]|uniref:RNA polymerase sigma factor n=1 Tax=Paenibacillus sp. R14(2021) TaxID=2859228 RepID=UPI001C613CEC|nr:RNA polymerase sigma factor [Paenibacillus sp. R14(2021)]
MGEDYLHDITKLEPPEVDALVRRYWHDVWQYAYFLTRREHLAEDIAQDTFIQAIRRMDTFRGQSSIKSWLFKIARNTAFNYKKSAFLRKVTLVGLFMDTRRSPSAESDYMSTSLTDEIWAAVLRLPRNHREMIILHAHYEMSYNELADLLAISEGTVKSRLYRARAKLAKLLKEADLHETENR